MLKKSITYRNFNDEEVTEDFYFNISKAELVEMEMSVTGGLKEHLEKIVAAEDGKQIIAEMKGIILKAYGKKSEDGKSFIKNQQLRDEFESSEAYSEFFMEIVTDATKAAEFINGIVPKDLQDQVAQERAKIEAAVETTEPPNLTPTPKRLTEAEVREMDAEEFKSGLATGKYIYP